MKRLTYVTVIGKDSRLYRVNARVSKADPQVSKRNFVANCGGSGGLCVYYRYRDEGITWARGWHTKDAKALEAVEALR